MRWLIQRILVVTITKLRIASMTPLECLCCWLHLLINFPTSNPLKLRKPSGEQMRSNEITGHRISASLFNLSRRNGDDYANGNNSGRGGQCLSTGQTFSTTSALMPCKLYMEGGRNDAFVPN